MITMIIRNDSQVIHSMKITDKAAFELKQKFYAAEKISIPNQYGQLIPFYPVTFSEDYEPHGISMTVGVIVDMKTQIVDCVMP